MVKHPPRFPTLDHVWLFAAVALIGLRPLLTPIPPNDFWWHMATGRLIVEQGRIPTVDAFSYTQAGAPFFNQSWLAQVLMYGLYRLGGVPLLLLVQAVVLALAYGLLLRLCVWRTGDVRLSVGLLLLTTLPLSFDNWIVRPQSYTFPIFAAFLYILSAYRLGRCNYLWLLPPLMVLWVNLHGAFVLGGALIALTLALEWLKRRSAARREELSWAARPVGEPADVLSRPAPAPQPPLLPLLLWGAATAAALLLNPRGAAVLGYVRSLLSSSAVSRLVSEWAPPTIRDANGIIFFLFVLVLVAVLTYTQRAPDLADLLLAGVFFWLALGAVRNIVWFGMVATPLLAVQAGRLGGPALQQGRRFQGLPVLNWMLIGVLGLLLLLGLPWVKPALDLPPELGALIDANTPVQATQCMQQQPQRPERLFHSMAYGSYLIWALPQQKVFIDPRIELYPFEQWRDYIALGGGGDVERLIARYGFDAMLLDKEEQAGLLDTLRADGGWRLACDDEYSAYLVKR
jgi:hypothetical protein